MLVQPIHAGFRDREDLSLDWVRGAVRDDAMLLVFPSMHFTGHHPTDADLGVTGLVTGDSIVATLVASGIDPDSVGAIMTSPDLLSDHLVQREIAISIAEMARREIEDRIDIKLSPLLESDAEQGQLFHFVNHPFRQVYAFILNQIMARLGFSRRLPVDGRDWQEVPHIPLLPAVHASLARMAGTALGGPEIGDEAVVLPGREPMTQRLYFQSMAERLAECQAGDLLATVHGRSWPRDFLGRFTAAVTGGLSPAADALTPEERIEAARQLAAEIAGLTRCNLPRGPLMEANIADLDVTGPQLPAAGIGHSLDEARAAHQRGDWTAAAGLWERVRTLAPDAPEGFASGAAAMRNLGRLAEAEAILLAGMASFPADPGLAAGFADMAAHRREWGEALARWSQFRTRFPHHAAGFIGAAWAFREQGQFDLADVLLDEALRHHPGHSHILRDRAWVAHLRGDWSEAARRWEQVRVAEPHEPQGFVHGAEAYLNLGEFAAADALLLAGTERFPDDRRLVVGFAEAAVRCNDWPEALRRWAAARRRFPLDRDVQARLFETRMRVVEADPDGAVPADAELAAPEDRRMCEIMMACESLGGARFGCEFGGIQRAFGAEPLGLLRWADADPGHIIPALEQRFEGVGLPENTEISTYASGTSREYGTRDTRFSLAMHTFIDVDSVPAETVLPSVCRRLQFLRRKLIDDLESGAKLFVYKLTYATLTDDELTRLHAAVRSYGPATLLYVRTADAEHPDGTVVRVRPGLLVGYLDHFGVTADDQPLTMPVESWGRVCERAFDLWKSGGDEVADDRDARPGPLPSIGGAMTLPPVRWEPGLIARLQAEADDPAGNPVNRRFRDIMARAGRREPVADLRRLLEDVATEHPAAYRGDSWFYDNYVLASMTAGAFDLASGLVRDRFGAEWICEPLIEAAGNPVPVMRWNVVSRTCSRFLFEPDAFAAGDATISVLLAWARSMPLYDGYHRSDELIPGTTNVSLFDAGIAPGIAFCGSRSDHFVVTDMEYLYRDGHSAVRTEIDARSPPWENRHPVAFWRGGTTGHWDGKDWHTLPRIRLCEMAAGSGGRIDAGLSSIVQMEPRIAREIVESGLLKGSVPPAAFADYRFLVDIDGNSNSWSGLFYRLYTGSTVLKVNSPFNFRLWYYDRLVPWHNYVPVASDMADLMEKVEWLQRNDEVARDIGRRGRELAVSLDYETEVMGAARTITAALRQDAFLRSR